MKGIRKCDSAFSYFLVSFQVGSSHIFRYVSYIEVKGARLTAKKEEMLKILPRGLKTILGQVPVDFKGVQEIRLRSGKPMMMICENREYLVTKEGRLRQDQGGLDMNGFLTITQSQMKETVEYMSSSSLYVAEEELRQGFLIIQGGHCIGVVGKTLVQGQDIRLMKSISFTNTRVAHEILGCADPVMDHLYMDRFLNTLITSPPRCGKTTLLRDIIRQVSNGRNRDRRISGISVGMVDEWLELAACYQGIPRNDLGVRMDVPDCCPKSRGMMMLVRTMASGAIAVDEIGSRQDMEAIEYVRNCGYSLMAIIHGNSPEDIRQKSCMGEFLTQGTFERLILLGSRGGPRRVRSMWDGGGDVLYGEKDPGS